MQQLKMKVTLWDIIHVKQENNFILPRNMTTLFIKLLIPKVLIRHIEMFCINLDQLDFTWVDFRILVRQFNL